MKDSYIINTRTRIVLPTEPAELFHFDPEAILTGEPDRVRDAAVFLRNAIRQMTTVEPAIVNANLKTAFNCIVLTTLDASPRYREDRRVSGSLQPDFFERLDDPSYNEAYCAFIEARGPANAQKRVVVLGNTASGLLAGVVALAGSVGYEVLGFGPNWVYAPRFKPPPAGRLPKSGDTGLALSFDLIAGRPSFWVRDFSVSANMNEIGTLNHRAIEKAIEAFGADREFEKMSEVLNGLSADPRFELTEDSNRRWEIGRRIRGASLSADFGFHHIGTFKDLITATVGEEGFLPPPKNSYINFAHPRVRDIILNKMWDEANAFFHHTNYEKMPWFIFAKIGFQDGWNHMDGDVNLLGAWTNWYREYRAAEGPSFGSYRLHGFHGINQPMEMWDPNSASDQLAGLANWLLDQFNRRVEADNGLDAATKAHWKSHTRIFDYSYGTYVTPPHFNLDPRVCVIFGGGGGSPGNRPGEDRWCDFVNKRRQFTEVFQAMGLQPPGSCLVYDSIATGNLNELFPIGLEKPHHTWVPDELRRRLRSYFDNGIRGYSLDHWQTFGRDGLMFYIISELLWNAALDEDGLDTLIARWFQRAFGAGAGPMRRAYEWMYRENLPYNHELAWAEVVDLINQAERLIDSVAELAQKRRLNDVKLYWYYFFILRHFFKPTMVLEEPGSGHYIWLPEERARVQALPEFRKYVWKGQMAYAMPLGHVCRDIYQVPDRDYRGDINWLLHLVQRYPGAFDDFILAGHPYFQDSEIDALWESVTRNWSALRIKRRFAVRPSPYLERTIFVEIRPDGPGRKFFEAGAVGEPVEWFITEPGRLLAGRVLPELEELDENDLVQVDELQRIASITGSGTFTRSMMSMPFDGNYTNYFYTVANEGQDIGCHLVWKEATRRGIENGADYWDAAARRWRVNEVEPDVVCSDALDDDKQKQVATIRRRAPYRGTYRVWLHGNLPNFLRQQEPRILGLHMNPVSEDEVPVPLPLGGMVFRAPRNTEIIAPGITSPGKHLFFYVPRYSAGLESHTHKQLRSASTLHLIDGPLPTPSYGETDRIRGVRINLTSEVSFIDEYIDQVQAIDVREVGYYTFDPLGDQYKGSLLSVKVNGGFADVPYFYTLPNWFAPWPNTLLIPRRVAEIDGLTIICPTPRP